MRLPVDILLIVFDIWLAEHAQPRLEWRKDPVDVDDVEADGSSPDVRALGRLLCLVGNHDLLTVGRKLLYRTSCVEISSRQGAIQLSRRGQVIQHDDVGEHVRTLRIRVKVGNKIGERGHPWREKVSSLILDLLS